MLSEENAPDAVGTQQLTSPSGVGVVLNGGTGKMESAMIPVQWFFSESIAKRDPTHVLIIEQNVREMGNGEQDRWTGRRHLVKISDGVKFIELHRPGNHRLILLVLSSGASQDERLELLSTENGGYSSATSCGVRKTSPTHSSVQGSWNSRFPRNSSRGNRKPGSVGSSGAG